MSCHNFLLLPPLLLLLILFLLLVHLHPIESVVLLSALVARKGGELGGGDYYFIFLEIEGVICVRKLEVCQVLRLDLRSQDLLVVFQRQLIFNVLADQICS